MHDRKQIEAFRNEFYILVDRAEHIVITAHISPDADSIASVLSLYTILKSKYAHKDIRIIYTGEAPGRFSIFHNFEAIEFVDDMAHHTAGTDLLIILDVNQLHRVTRLPELLKNIPNIIAIDHHASAPDIFTLLLIIPTKTANAELIYYALAEGEQLTKELAELFLLGILSDTGNLSFIGPQQTEVLILTKTLVDTIGISINEFSSRYDRIPKQLIPVLQTLIRNTQYKDISGWPPMQYTYIDRATMLEADYSDEDMSAASHIYMSQYLPKILGYGWGLVATPRSDGSGRISGRSLPGSVNVRDLFERMEIGGGHNRAAGAYMKSDSPIEPTEAIDRICSWMKINEPMLG